MAPQVAVTSGNGFDQNQGPCTDGPSRVGADLAVVIDDLNPVLRGWGAYCVSRGRARLNRKEAGSDDLIVCPQARHRQRVQVPSG